MDTVAQNWTQVSVTGSVPPLSGMQTMVVDSNDVMWIFGGSLCCGSGTFYNNLFTLNTATEVWAEVVATGSVPTSRRKHTAVMDSSDRMWVFAGELSDGTKTNELYYLETATPNWVQVTASGTLPSEREKHVAVMDSSDRMWVYGGHLGSSTLSDLQVLDTATETWTEVVAANTPPRRYFAVGVAGSPEVMWLWSGYNGGSFLPETWARRVEISKSDRQLGVARFSETGPKRLQSYCDKMR